MTCNIRTSSYT